MDTRTKPVDSKLNTQGTEVERKDNALAPSSDDWYQYSKTATSTAPAKANDGTVGYTDARGKQ